MPDGPDERLEERWSRVELDDPPVDGTIRPPADELGAAHTLAAPPTPSEPPPPIGAGPAGEIELLHELGKGGMSSVMLARQRSLRREVAVKTALAEDASSAAAILAEGRITGALEHPSIVPVHLLGLDDEGRPAIVMKRVVGVTWATLIEDPAHEGWQGWAGAPDDRLPGHLQIITAICNALHFAHSRGWVHRDVKPANVLIGRFGDVYLADWGIAAPVGTKAGSICGTPGYLSPEMALGDPVDARTDVYLLGACLHHVLMGRPRHAAPDALSAITLSIVSMPFTFPERVPFELAELTNRACHLEIDARPPTALALRDALADFALHRESVALAEEAEALLDGLGEAAEAEATPAEAAELDQRRAQASFAIERARQTWPDNPVAARARARLDALMARRRAREAELANDAREHDPAVGGRPRASLLAIGAVGALTLSATSIFVGWPGDPRVGLVAYPALLFAFSLAVAFAFRRRVTATRFNRSAVATVLVLVGVLPFERAVAAFSGVAFTTIYAFEGFMWGVALLVYGITSERWTLWVAAVCFVSAVTTMLFPSQAVWTYGAVSVVGITLVALLAWRARRRQ